MEVSSENFAIEELNRETMPAMKKRPPKVNPEPSVAVPQASSSGSMSRSSAMEMVDIDGPTQTISAIDIRPQAMAPLGEVEVEGMSTKTLLALFSGGAVLLFTGILSVVLIFGKDKDVTPVVPTSVQTTEEPDINAASDTWEGTRFQTPIDSKRIKVKCGDIQGRGTEIVTLPDVAGGNCFVEVRTPDRQSR